MNEKIEENDKVGYPGAEAITGMKKATRSASPSSGFVTPVPRSWNDSSCRWTLAGDCQDVRIARLRDMRDDVLFSDTRCPKLTFTFTT